MDRQFFKQKDIWNLAIVTAVMSAWMGSNEAGHTVTQITRSAKAGDPCNSRRDVVLLNVAHFNTSYLQCQRHGANGTNGMWRTITCPPSHEFSFSRQRCVFPLAEQNMVAADADAARVAVLINSSYTGNGSRRGHAGNNRVGRPRNRLWTTTTPFPVQHRQKLKTRNSTIRSTAATPSTADELTVSEQAQPTSTMEMSTENYSHENATETFSFEHTTESPAVSAKHSETPASALIPWPIVQPPTLAPVLETPSIATRPIIRHTAPQRRLVQPATATPRRRIPMTTPSTITSTSSTSPTTTATPMIPPTIAYVPLPLSYGALGYPCTADLRCIDANSVCISNICQCAYGYAVHSYQYQYICAPFFIPTLPPRPPPPMPPADIGQPCSNSKGPLCRTRGAQCRQGLCRCPKRHIAQDDVCVPAGPKPGELCEPNGPKCTGESVCIQGKCICKEGDFIQNGVCAYDSRPRPGQPCNVHLGPEFDQCASKSYCALDVGLCTCTEDFVVINWTCAAKWLQAGQPCQSPPQTCVNGAQCINSICQYLPPTPTTDRTHTAMDAALNCPDGWLLLELDQKRYCAPAMLQLGEMCLSPKQTCTGGSVCHGGVCACPDGFNQLHMYCVLVTPPAAELRRALGTTCSDNVECAWANGLCHERHCVCPAGSNAIFGSCRRPEAPYSVTGGGYCTVAIHCVPGLSCVYGVCVCLPGYDCESLARHPSSPGASCVYTQHCGDGATCANGWCVCIQADMIVDHGRCMPRHTPKVEENVNWVNSHGHRHHAPHATVTASTHQPLPFMPFQPAPVLPGLLPTGNLQSAVNREHDT